MNFNTHTPTTVKTTDDRLSESWIDQAERRWEVQRIFLDGDYCYVVSTNGSGFVMSREEIETLKNAIGFVLTTV